MKLLFKINKNNKCHKISRAETIICVINVSFIEELSSFFSYKMSVSLSFADETAASEKEAVNSNGENINK